MHCFPRTDSPLLSLAPELLRQIVNFIESDFFDLKTCRLVCRTLNTFVEYRVLRSLKIEITRLNAKRNIAHLKALAETNHAGSYATRKLIIGSLSPQHEPAWHFKSVSLLSSNQERFPAPDTANAIREINRYIVLAISSLKNVSEVKWVPCSQDDIKVLDAVTFALRDLPNLRIFHMHLNDCMAMGLEIHSLTHLEEIFIHGMSQDHAGDLQSLQKLIKGNPNLRSIDLYDSHTHNADQIRALHALFTQDPQIKPLRLHHLGLKYSSVHLDEITLPHLTHLTSLVLLDIEVPYGPPPPGVDPEIHKLKRVWGSGLTEFWTTLKVSEILLDEITVDVVNPSFLDYLSSYSGVKKLHLDLRDFDNETKSTFLASQFFDKPLHNHLATLEDLRIAPVFEGSWCFTPNNFVLLSKCSRLLKLCLSVISFQLTAQENSVLKPNAVISLLNLVSRTMPRLQKLQILPAALQTHRGSFGRVLLEDKKRTTEEVANIVVNYTAPRSCLSLPDLLVGYPVKYPYIGEKQYGFVVGAGLRPLRYVGVSDHIEFGIRPS